MTPSSIVSIRAKVAQARTSLLEPGANLTSVLLALESAATELRELGANTPICDLEALRLDLARVAKLARNGEDFWRGWGRLLGLEPAYTSEGLLAVEALTSRIVVQG